MPELVFRRPPDNSRVREYDRHVPAINSRPNVGWPTGVSRRRLTVRGRAPGASRFTPRPSDCQADADFATMPGAPGRVPTSPELGRVRHESKPLRRFRFSPLGRRQSQRVYEKRTHRPAKTGTAYIAHASYLVAFVAKSPLTKSPTWGILSRLPLRPFGLSEKPAQGAGPPVGDGPCVALQWRVEPAF